MNMSPLGVNVIYVRSAFRSGRMWDPAFLTNSCAPILLAPSSNYLLNLIMARYEAALTLTAEGMSSLGVHGLTTFGALFRINKWASRFVWDYFRSQSERHGRAEVCIRQVMFWQRRSS